MKNLFILTTVIGLIIFQYSAAKHPQVEEIFTSHYQSGEWGLDENGNGTSGSGSSLEEAMPYFNILTDFLQQHEIKTVIDIGCGDWQFSRHVNWEGIDYVGYDVVKSVIKKNIAAFSKPNISFIHGNGIATNLPKSDLLICKDVLQHLPYFSINRLLGQLHKFKYCLITNDVDPEDPRQNIDIPPGHLRPLDLTLAPFNLEAVKYLDYQSGITHKQVLLIVNTDL